MKISTFTIIALARQIPLFSLGMLFCIVGYQSGLNWVVTSILLVEVTTQILISRSENIEQQVLSAILFAIIIVLDFLKISNDLINTIYLISAFFITILSFRNRPRSNR